MLVAAPTSGPHNLVFPQAADGSIVFFDTCSRQWRHRGAGWPIAGKDLATLVRALRRSGHVLDADTVSSLGDGDALGSHVALCAGVLESSSGTDFLVYVPLVGAHGTYLLVRRALERAQSPTGAAVHALVNWFAKQEDPPATASAVTAKANWGRHPIRDADGAPGETFRPLSHLMVPHRKAGRPGFNASAATWAAVTGQTPPPIYIPSVLPSNLFSAASAASAVVLHTVAARESTMAPGGGGAARLHRPRQLASAVDNVIVVAPFLKPEPPAAASGDEPPPTPPATPVDVKNVFCTELPMSAVVHLCEGQDINPSDAATITPDSIRLGALATFSTEYCVSADPPLPDEKVKVSVAVDVDACILNSHVSWQSFVPLLQQASLVGATDAVFLSTVAPLILELVGVSNSLAQFTKAPLFSTREPTRGPTAAGHKFSAPAENRVPLPTPRLDEPFRASISLPYSKRFHLYLALRDAAAHIVTMPNYTSDRLREMGESLLSPHESSSVDCTYEVPGGLLLQLLGCALLSFRATNQGRKTPVASSGLYLISYETYNFKMRGCAVELVRRMRLSEAQAAANLRECCVKAARDLNARADAGATGTLRSLNKYFAANGCTQKELLVGYGFHVRVEQIIGAESHDSAPADVPAFGSFQADLSQLEGWRAFESAGDADVGPAGVTGDVAAASGDAAGSSCAADSSSAAGSARASAAIVGKGRAFLQAVTLPVAGGCSSDGSGDGSSDGLKSCMPRVIYESPRRLLTGHGADHYPCAYLPLEISCHTVDLENPHCTVLRPHPDLVRSQSYVPGPLGRGATGESYRKAGHKNSDAVGTAQHVAPLTSAGLQGSILRIDSLSAAWDRKASSLNADFVRVWDKGSDARLELLYRVRSTRSESALSVDAGLIHAGLTQVLRTIEARPVKPIVRYLTLMLRVRHEIGIAALACLRGNAATGPANADEQLHLVRIASEFGAFLGHFSSGRGILWDRRFFCAGFGTLAGRCVAGAITDSVWRALCGVGVEAAGTLFRQKASDVSRMLRESPTGRFVPSTRVQRAEKRAAQHEDRAAAAPPFDTGKLPVCAHEDCLMLCCSVESLVRHHVKYPSHVVGSTVVGGSYLSASSERYLAALNRRYAAWKDPAQLQAFHRALAGHNVLLLGGAGCGKTFTTGNIGVWLTLESGPASIVVCGTTGAAARVAGECGLDSTTMHSRLGLGLFEYWETAEEVVARIRAAPSALNVWLSMSALLLEESCNLSAAALDKLELIARLLRNNPRAFGGVQLVFNGSFLQLEPFARATEDGSHAPPTAADKQPFYMARCFPDLFAYDSMFVLNTMHRLAGCDAVLQEAHARFDRLQLGIPLRSDIDFLTDITKQGAEAQRLWDLVEADPVEAGRLDGRNVPLYQVALHKEADRINTRLFLANKNPCIRLLATDTRNGDVVPTDASGACASKVGAPAFLEVKVGVRLAITRNMPELHLVNTDLVDVLAVDNPGPDTRSARLHVRMLDGSRVWLPPFPFQTRSGAVERVRYAFAAQIAYACSIHGSQGMSVDNTMVDLGGIFACGDAYTALTRSRSLPGSRVINLKMAQLRFCRTSIEFMLHLMRAKAPAAYARYLVDLALWKAEITQGAEARLAAHATAAVEAARILGGVPATHGICDRGADVAAQIKYAVTGAWRTGAMHEALSRGDGVLAMLMADSYAPTGVAEADALHCARREHEEAAARTEDGDEARPAPLPEVQEGDDADEELHVAARLNSRAEKEAACRVASASAAAAGSGAGVAAAAAVAFDNLFDRRRVRPLPREAAAASAPTQTAASSVPAQTVGVKRPREAPVYTPPTVAVPAAATAAAAAPPVPAAAAAWPRPPPVPAAAAAWPRPPPVPAAAAAWPRPPPVPAAHAPPVPAAAAAWPRPPTAPAAAVAAAPSAPQAVNAVAAAAPLPSFAGALVGRQSAPLVPPFAGALIGRQARGGPRHGHRVSAAPVRPALATTRNPNATSKVPLLPRPRT